MEDELKEIDGLVCKYINDQPCYCEQPRDLYYEKKELAQAILTLIRKREEQARKAGRSEIEKELMAELRDPCGTIWEHAKRLQDENDRLKQQLAEVEDGKT